MIYNLGNQYGKQNAAAQKHHDDLVMIGYKFPEISLEPIDLNDLF